MPKLSQSPDIGQNSDGDISDFRTSGQSLIKENCYNSRTSHATDMKLGPVTKLDKRNTATSKKLTMTSCMQIVTSLSFFRFVTNLKLPGSRIPDAWSVKLTFSLTVNALSYKTWKQDLKICNAAVILLLWVKVLFLQKILISFKKFWYQQD